MLARTAPADGWAAIVIGQSIGGLLAIVVTWGWPLIGPRLVAGASEVEANNEYLQSVKVRALILLGLLPLAATIAWLLAPRGFELDCLLMAAAGGAAGLSPAWFAVGRGLPSIIARYELIPRAVAMLAAAGAMAVTNSIVIYPILLLTASILGPGVFTQRVRHQHSRWKQKQKLFGFLRRNATGVLAEVLGGSYSTSTTALVAGAGSPQVAGAYSSAEKIYRIGLFAVSSVSNALQNWIASVKVTEKAKRLRLALLIHCVLGVMGGLTLIIAGPWVTEILFTTELRASPTTCAWLGAAYLAISINTCLGRHFLAIAGRMRAVLLSTMVGGLVGIPSILLGVTHFGSEGAAAAVAASEAVVCVIQALAIRVPTKTDPGIDRDGSTFSLPEVETR